MSDITIGRITTLSEYEPKPGWIGRQMKRMKMDDKDKRIAQLEATCAAMRVALDAFADDSNWWDSENGPAWRGPMPNNPEGLARAALSSDPGKEILERLDRAEKDTARIDKVERLGIESTKALLGRRVKVGFLCGADGEILSGMMSDGYKHKTVRAAIDAAKEPA